MKKDFLLRLFFAVSCTLLSWMGIKESLENVDLSNPLWIATWGVYFLILCIWIKNSRVPKTIAALGSVLSVLSLASTFFFALAPTFTAVVLMAYIVLQSLKEPKSAAPHHTVLPTQSDSEPEPVTVPIDSNTGNRLLFAIGCTLLSSFTVAQSWKAHLENPLWMAAWTAYFLILFFWIKNGHAPKWLLAIGTVLGCLSLGSTNFFALLPTLASVLLMLYVIVQSAIHSNSETPSQKGT